MVREQMCLCRFMITVLVLLGIAYVANAEDPQTFAAVLQINSPSNLLDAFFAMPEISCIDGGSPGKTRKLIQENLLVGLEQKKTLGFGVVVDKEYRLQFVIRREDGWCPFGDRMLDLIRALEAMLAPQSELREALGKPIKISPAFQPDFEKCDVAGWLDPAPLVLSIDNAFTKEAEIATHQKVSICRRKCRRLEHILSSGKASDVKDLKEGSAISLPEVSACPLGGTYHIEKIVSSGTQSLYVVDCDHLLPAPTFGATDTPFGKLLLAVRDQLKTLPPLNLKYSAADGVFRIELPKVLTQPPYDLSSALPQVGPIGKLVWVPVDQIKLPLNSEFGVGVFVGINPISLLGDGGDAERMGAVLKDIFSKPGLIILGALEESGLESSQGPVFGINVTAKELASLAASISNGTIGEPISEEVEGVDVMTYSQGAPNGKVYFFEKEGRTFLHLPFFSMGGRSDDPSKEQDVPCPMRILLRTWNGEAQIVPQPLTGEVKLAIAVRMDLVGRLIAQLADEIELSNEMRTCAEGVRTWLESHDATSQQAQERLFGATGEIPADLQNVCPKHALMWHPDRKCLTCAVHARELQRFIASGVSAALQRQIPADRWLWLTLSRRDGKAFLEAKIVTGKEGTK